MKSQVITFFEHQSKTYQEIGWRSDDPRIEQLEKLVRDAQAPIFSMGRHSIKANQFVGIVRLSKDTFQILPKIDYEGSSEESKDEEQRQKAVYSATRNLLAMLSYTHDIQLRARDLAGLKEQPADWFELLTRLYASELHAQLRLGPERAYIHYEDTLPVIRGRWELSRQLAAHLHIKHQFDVSYDEFSPDTPLNQIFRLVTHRLLQMTADSQNRHYLQDIRNWMDEIPPPTVSVQTNLSQIHFTRLNGRFRPAYNLARFFLGGLVFQLSAGSGEMFAFVLDMNHLFEEFIGRFLIRHWRSMRLDPAQESKIILQSQGKRIHLAEVFPKGKPEFQLIPDIQFLSASGRPRLIGDTKYKQLDTRKPHLGVVESDLYQMLAYSVRLDCPNLLLLYPQARSGKIQVVFQIHGQQQIVKIATLNMHTPFDIPNPLIDELREILISFFADEEIIHGAISRTNPIV